MLHLTQLPLIENICGYVWKGVTYFRNRKASQMAEQTALEAAQQAALLEQQEQQLLNLLRTRTYANCGN